MERPIDLYIILFNNHSPFQNQLFVILSILSEMHFKNVFKHFKTIFSAKKTYFSLECMSSFLPFYFVIWQVVYEYMYSLRGVDSNK